MSICIQVCMAGFLGVYIRGSGCDCAKHRGRNVTPSPASASRKETPHAHPGSLGTWTLHLAPVALKDGPLGPHPYPTFVLPRYGTVIVQQHPLYPCPCSPFPRKWKGTIRQNAVSTS